MAVENMLQFPQVEVEHEQIVVIGLVKSDVHIPAEEMRCGKP